MGSLTLGVPAEPTLVGREQQLGQLLKHLDSAFSGHGKTVLIGGEAGVGKTRLVREFLGLAKKRETKVLSGWCLSEAAVPYFPFTEAFSTFVSTMNNGKMKVAITKQLGITGWLIGSEIAKDSKTHELFANPQIDRDRTFEAAAAAILQLSANDPTILFVDDLHWADHLSLALLHYLSRKCRNSRLLIIGTYRSEELVRAKEEKLHPLEETMFSMGREDLLTKMELTRLKREDFPELLRSMFHSSFDEMFVERLYRETEGNPLFLLETLNLLAEEGFLSEREKQWVITTQTEKIGIPSKVHEVIIRRIGRLEREERKLLDLAAVCGHSFNADLLGKTLALDIVDVLEKLVEIEKKHKLIRSVNSAFEFSHQKIREIIYENLQKELRRIYHLKMASCLEQVLSENASDEHLADIALHYVEGGAPERAFTHLVKLGEKAVNIYANAQAIEYLDKALETAQKTPSLVTKENLVKIYNYRGLAWLRQDERARARNDLSLMLRIAESINDESMIAKAHYFLSGTYEPYFGEMDENMQHLTIAVEMARKTGNKNLEVRGLGAIGESLMWGKNPDAMDEGCVKLEESIRRGKEIGDKVNEEDNLVTLGMYYNWKGEFSHAKENLKEALALNQEVGTIQKMAFAQFCMCMVLAGNGEYDEAISTGQRCLQIAQDNGLVSLACMILNTLGWIYHDLSNIELAIKYNNEAIELAKAHQKSRASGAVPSSLSNLGMDHLNKKEYEKAEKCFNEVANMYDQHRGGWWRMEVRILLGRGEITLAQGNYTQSLRLAEDSLVISERGGAKKYIAKGLKLKADALAKMGRTKEAVEAMKEALDLAQQVGNPPVLWQIHHSLGLLLEGQGNLQAANAHHAEATAIIEATASRLNDPALKKSLLMADHTKAIHDAYTRTRPKS